MPQHICGGQDNLGDLVITFHCVGPGDWTHVIRLGSKCLYWLQLTNLTGSDICYFCQPSIPVSPSRNNALFVLGEPMSAFPYHVTWRYFLLPVVLQVARAWLGSKAASTATMLSVGGRYTTHVGTTSSFSLEFARRKSLYCVWVAKFRAVRLNFLRPCQQSLSSERKWSQHGRKWT